MTRFESSTPWARDDPRSPDFSMELSEYRHTNGKIYIKFVFTACEGVMSSGDARAYAESLRHFADQIDGLSSAPPPPPPRQTWPRG